MPSSLMLYRTSEQGVSSVDINEQTGVQNYGITELARRQLADKLKIPYAYFDRMRTEQPHLLDRNVNTWLQQGNDDKRLIRTLDGRVRAVLSDRYRRLDNFDLVKNALPILQRLPEARFESVELTETRMYLKVVTPSVPYEIAPGGCRPGRRGSQNPRRAHSRACRGVRARVQGRYVAGRRCGLFPEGPRRGRSCRVRSDLPPGYGEAAENDGHQAHGRSGEER